MKTEYSYLTRLAILVLSTSILGCAGYRLGSTLPPHLKTIFVDQVHNDTNEPELATLLTRDLNREFRRDGTLSPALSDQCDMVLTTRIIGFRLDPVAYDTTDPKAANDYRLTVSAQVVASDRIEGKTLLASVINGDTLLASGGDLNSAQRSALPKATRDLAQQIVNNIISVW